jgi:hypothetical protein
MNVVDRNQLYIKGIIEHEGLFPHLDEAPKGGFFSWDFGLPVLPEEPGIIVIRGPVSSARALGSSNNSDRL